MLSLGLAIGVAVAVVLCIGALVLLVLLGLKRYAAPISARLAAAKASSDEKQEMEWDNSALNITVNPLDGECSYEDECDYEKQADEESHKEEDEASEGSDEERDDKDTPKCAVIEVKELEWDDSTLSY